MSVSQQPQPLYLQKGKDRRLRQGHLWVFSNEVDTRRTPLNAFTPGAAVEVRASNGSLLGSGYINPHSLICARLCHQDVVSLGTDFFIHRIEQALALRQRIYPEPFYRLIYGESDGLPGLVVDRFDGVLVVQIATLGMESRIEPMVEALDRVIKPQAIVLKNDATLRALEGLESYVRVAQGTCDEQVRVVENGVEFQAPVLSGQKTGWFYDHRENRAWMGRWSRGLRVLDLFSYLGGWGIQAACGGAREVVCVDASAEAIRQVSAHAELNGVAQRVTALRGDAFEQLRALRDARERFDIIVVDPPAFIKRRKDQRAGEQAYRRINDLAMRLLDPGGLLVSASCSHHMSAAHLQSHLWGAAHQRGRQLQILAQGGQGPDHPIHPAIPETSYLKAFLLRVAQR